MKLLYLSMLGFVFISTFALSLFEPGVVYKEAEVEYKSRDDLSLLPVLKDENNVPVLSAQGAIAIDLDSRVVLYEKDPDLQLLPASTTKIMTALVALDTYPIEAQITIGKVRVVGQKMGLVWGEKIGVGDLLDGLLIFSGNDAAEALAMAYPGGRDAFVEAMNAKARELHLANTHFENPTGLDQEGHTSTARDMVFLAEVAMRNKTFSEIVGTKAKTVRSSDGLVVHNLRNVNELLGQVDGVLGVKTGWTEGARENLVTYVERDGKRVLIAILGSQDRFGETKEMIDWVFGSYSWERIQVPSVS
jgi:D-alanyl-D-alanine carboxypeptidase (penicillin-binding protein 5/6)